MSRFLSNEDVQRLLAEPSATARAEVAAKVGGNLDDADLSDAERRLAEDIVRRMARDVETRVRQALAQSVMQVNALPRDVALTLARDVETVALPIIRMSQVLTDQDLIEIVRGGDPDRQTAVASRPAVSAAVAGVVVEEAVEEAVSTLIRNPGAEVGDGDLSRAVERFAESDQVKEAVVLRPGLSIAMVERMMAVVSDRLLSELAVRHELPQATLSDLVLQSRERAVADLVGLADDAQLMQLVAQLARTGRMTPSLILRVLCTGDVAFLEAALAELADVPLMNARILVHDKAGLGALFEKAGLPAVLLPAVRIALAVIEETEHDGLPGDKERFRRRTIERILTQYETMAPEDLEYLLGKLGDLAA